MDSFFLLTPANCLDHDKRMRSRTQTCESLCSALADLPGLWVPLRFVPTLPLVIRYDISNCEVEYDDEKLAEEALRLYQMHSPAVSMSSPLSLSFIALSLI